MIRVGMIVAPFFACLGFGMSTVVADAFGLGGWIIAIGSGTGFLVGAWATYMVVKNDQG